MAFAMPSGMTVAPEAAAAIQPVAESAEPAVQPPAAKAAKPAAELAKPATKPEVPAAVVESPKPAAKLAKPATKSAKLVVKPPVPAARPAKPVAQPPVPTTEQPAPSPGPVAKAGKGGKARKPKLIRDSFTFPEKDYALIAVLKQQALLAGRDIKKSELLRAGLAALIAMSNSKLIKTLDGVERIKTGRPAK